MKRLEFHISYRCTHDCIFCSEYDRMSDFKDFPLTSAQIKTILIDRRKKGFDHVNFTGGEPTIVPGFLELLEFSKKLGYRIYVGTNGSSFISEDYTKRALEYIDELSISVHWFDKKTCLEQTSREGHFDNFSKIIGNISSSNVKSTLFLNIVLNKLNYRNVPEIMDFVVGTGYKPEQILISNMAPEGRGLMDYERLSFDLQEFQKHIPGLIDKADKLSIKLRFFGMPICIIGNGNEEFSNDSHWEPRNTIERVYMKDGKVGLVDIFSGDNSRERIFVKKCEDCEFRDRPCTGVFEKYLEFYDF